MPPGLDIDYNIKYVLHIDKDLIYVLRLCYILVIIVNQKIQQFQMLTKNSLGNIKDSSNG